MPSESCVWDEGPGLKVDRPLSDLYPDCDKLFCKILDITQKPSLDMLVEEVKHLAEGDLIFPADHVKPVTLPAASIARTHFGLSSPLT